MAIFKKTAQFRLPRFFGWRRSVPRIGDSATIGPESNPRHDDKREEDASRLSRTGRTWDKRPGAGFGPAGVYFP
jgi:hypothetical protein